MIPRKQILYILATLIIFVAILNYIAMKAMWYYIFWYFDMPMHFLGGVVLTLLVSYVLYNRITKEDIVPVLHILLAVLIIGVGWEVFEYVFNNVIAGQIWNMLDTLSDICFDMAGGVMGLFIIKDSLKPIKAV
jgi:hypothetical protein